MSEEKLVQIVKESVRRNYIGIKDEELERIVRESLKEAERYIITLKYDRTSLVEYLLKENKMKRDKAESTVSSIFDYTDNISKEQGYEPLSEEVKVKLSLGIIGSFNCISDIINKQ